MKYSETIQAHFESPKNVGSLPDATVIGFAENSSCLDQLTLFLKVENSRVTVAKYQVEGCVPSIALGSILTEYIVGRTTDELQKLTAEDLEQPAGGLPATKKHAALLAVEALQNGLEKLARVAQ